MRQYLFRHIENLWDYLQMHQQITPADCLFVLCSNDLRVAEYAAQLYTSGFGKKIIFSGGLGRFTEGVFEKSEAETFAAIAKDCGVPASDIILETQSSNTGENVTLTAQKLAEQQLHFDSFLLVQKPFMERRAYATFKQQWPHGEPKIQVTSPTAPFFDYLSDEMHLDMVLTAMLGDFERIKSYPKMGYQIEQTVPDDVESSYQYIRQNYPCEA